jgi:hypothetical protein
MSIYRKEFAHAINGVQGRMHNRITRYDAPHLFASQTWISKARDVSKQYGKNAVLSVEMRFDDNCKNGHASFAITGDVRISGTPDDKGWITGGRLHEDIAKTFPELAAFIPWHLTSTDGPMHYIANTLYFVKEGNLDAARCVAVWPEATEAALCLLREELKSKLETRLPALIERFHAAMEGAGFEWEPKR